MTRAWTWSASGIRGDELKAMLEKSGYAGEKLVLLHATDHIFFNPMGSVVAEMR